MVWPLIQSSLSFDMRHQREDKPKRNPEKTTREMKIAHKVPELPFHQSIHSLFKKVARMYGKEWFGRFIRKNIVKVGEEVSSRQPSFAS